ncbi:MAG TPA: bifunctional DNA primase/polymerase [Candidatus Dormibacteraeota bacterium]|nr:bifunctional DNA primase/polymerase [Candidatus Dormibacteraeota bacterium]
MRQIEPPLVEQARAYARRGWSVLPLWWPTATRDCACGLADCESTGKHPIRRLVPHGLHDASTRLDAIDEWWRLYPHANTGIRTGARSRLLVLDVDGEAGRLALRGVAAHHGRFDARWVQTGSRGWHAYFAHPGGSVPNSAGRLGVGLDVRGDGGYVVAPPSRHRSGSTYRWVDAREADRPLPAAPDWLLDLAGPAGHEPQPVLLLSDDVHAYAAAALASELREVAEAPPGQRNHQLNRSAFKLGQLVGARLLDEAAVTAALVAAGLSAGPGERKIRSTIRRGLQAGIRQPRQVVLRAEASSC